VARPAFAVLILTSLHHAYGAVLYGTPWRWHAVHVSVVTALVLLGALTVLCRPGGRTATRIATWVFLLTTVAIPVVGFGLFEGVYNHVLKDLLYFGGAPAVWLTRLFPPPTYEMPNDFLFEVSGILQVVPATVAAARLLRLGVRTAGGPTM
jgi:hypothetical protein